MGRELLVLAKSKKPGGFCVAGIEIDTNTLGRHRISNRWLRPVVASQKGATGALPAAACRNFGVLDHIKLECPNHTPAQGQPENYRWAESTITLLHKGSHQPNLDPFVNPTQKIWVDHTTASDHEISMRCEHIPEMAHSLMLAQPSGLTFTLSRKPNTLFPCITAAFTHNHHYYQGIPVTDPVLFRVFKNQFPRQGEPSIKKTLNHRDEYWLTMSLSPRFGARNSHYILVAAVIDKTGYLNRQYR